MKTNIAYLRDALDRLEKIRKQEENIRVLNLENEISYYLFPAIKTLRDMIRELEKRNIELQLSLEAGTD